MLVAAVLATYTRRRTVDGEEFSWWRQLPAKMFQNPAQSIVPMWPKGYTALKAGFFGRQVDAYHDRWYLWFTALLPLHLATLACLFALRRAGGVRARFSQNAVTLAVSCAHIVLVHGVGCVFSFGAMLATLGVCKAGLPLAVGRPRLYKLLVWALALSLLALSNRLDERTEQLFSPMSGALPPWVYNGVRASGSDSVVLPFGPFLAFRFLLLRLVSYCLDVGEEAHYQKGASAATARDLVSAEDFFVYVTYAPLYLHGPLVQYRSFSDQWRRRMLDSASTEKLGKKGHAAGDILQSEVARGRDPAPGARGALLLRAPELPPVLPGLPHHLRALAGVRAGGRPEGEPRHSGLALPGLHQPLAPLELVPHDVEGLLHEVHLPAPRGRVPGPPRGRGLLGEAARQQAGVGVVGLPQLRPPAGRAGPAGAVPVVPAAQLRGPRGEPGLRPDHAPRALPGLRQLAPRHAYRGPAGRQGGRLGRPLALPPVEPRLCHPQQPAPRAARGDGPPAGVLVRSRGRGCVAAPPTPPPPEPSHRTCYPVMSDTGMSSLMTRE